MRETLNIWTDANSSNNTKNTLLCCWSAVEVLWKCCWSANSQQPTATDTDTDHPLLNSPISIWGWSQTAHLNNFRKKRIHFFFRDFFKSRAKYPFLSGLINPLPQVLTTLQTVTFSHCTTLHPHSAVLS